MEEGYIIDGNRAAELIASNIYSPVSSIVEKVANYYDADATEVKIDFVENDDYNVKDYIKEIIITGDGEGFEADDLNSLREIGNSKKKEDMYTHKFNRVKLGSFGIAFTSFQNLGDEIEIYSKVRSGEIFYKKIVVENKLPVFGDIKRLNCCDLIKYNTGCALVIKKCKIHKSAFTKFDLLKNKLAYLPLSENFKIYLCGEEIKQYIIDDETFYKQTFDFYIDNIYFSSKVYYAPYCLKNEFFRGVYLKIDGRIIDWNIFNEIRRGVTTGGAVENRIQGYIIANELRDKINASRSGLTDNNLSLTISEILKSNIRYIFKKARKHYGWEDKTKSKKNFRQNKKIQIPNKNTDNMVTCNNKNICKNVKIDKRKVTIEQKEKYNKSERVEKAKKRLKSPNKDLKRLEIKFCYEPESEIELIIIVAQIWQKGLLDFDIIQAISSEYPDSIIMKDGEVAFLEFEQELNNFYIHNHNHNKVSYIICWSIDEKTIDNKKEAYLKNYSGYLQSIEIEKTVKELCSNNLIFNNYDGTQHIVKLYILSDIIKKLKI